MIHKEPREYVRHLLAEYMNKNELSLRMVAQDYRVSASTVSRWLDGRSDIPGHVVIEIIGEKLPVRCPHCNGSGFVKESR